MADKIPCRYPACEDDTDCMNGCQPAPNPLRRAAGYPMMKIQQKCGNGWANCTRVTGGIEYGHATLASYRRNWPAGTYRLVLADAFEGDKMERYEVLAE